MLQGQTSQASKTLVVVNKRGSKMASGLTLKTIHQIQGNPRSRNPRAATCLRIAKVRGTVSTGTLEGGRAFLAGQVPIRVSSSASISSTRQTSRLSLKQATRPTPQSKSKGQHRLTFTPPSPMAICNRTFSPTSTQSP